jgi:hypothetical protein
MPWAFALLLLGLWTLTPAAHLSAIEPGEVRTWVCYYGSADRTAELARFDLAVLDPATPLPPRAPDGRPIRLGYLSLGEVDKKGPHARLVKGRPFVIGEDGFWESWKVDARSPEWQRLVLERLAPGVLAAGFDGLFLDTLDTALDLEAEQPERFKGMGEALAGLVREIRRRWPGAYLCQNRGFAVLDRTARDIDFLLLEGLSSTMNHDSAAYVRVADTGRAWLTDQAESARRLNPGLVILSLDYAGPEDEALAQEALAFARKNRFVPYVGDYLLDAVSTRTLAR